MSQEDSGSCSKLLNFYNYLIHLRNGPRLVTRAGQAFRADKLRKVLNSRTVLLRPIMPEWGPTIASTVYVIACLPAPAMKKSPRWPPN